jgi:hypothetical protein
MSEVAEVWKKIDKHAEQIQAIERDVFGIGSRMGVLESSFQNHTSQTAQGQARIETKIECVQKSLQDLHAKNSYESGLETARKEQKTLIKWLVGLVITLITSGIIAINVIPK